MFHFVFFRSSTATPVPPPLLCSTCLIFLLNILAIYQELLFTSILKKIAKLQTFGKVVGLQHPNLLK